MELALFNIYIDFPLIDGTSETLMVMRVSLAYIYGYHEKLAILIMVKNFRRFVMFRFRCLKCEFFISNKLWFLRDR